MNLNKFLLVPIALACSAIALPAQAFTLSVSDGTTTVTVVDNGVGDNSPVTGLLNYIGSLGVWIINVQTATSNAPGSTSLAQIHLTSTLQSTAAGTLTMMVWDTFQQPLGAGELEYFSIGGSNTIDGSLRGYAIKNVLEGSRTEYFQTAACGYTFSGSCSSVLAHPELSGAYELRLVQTVTVNGASNSFSIDSDAFNSVPEPGSLALLGLGLLGLAGAARRRAK